MGRIIAHNSFMLPIVRIKHARYLIGTRAHNIMMRFCVLNVIPVNGTRLVKVEDFISENEKQENDKIRRMCFV